MLIKALGEEVLNGQGEGGGSQGAPVRRTSEKPLSLKFKIVFLDISHPVDQINIFLARKVCVQDFLIKIASSGFSINARQLTHYQCLHQH